MAYITRIQIEECRNVRGLDVDLSVPDEHEGSNGTNGVARPAFRHLILTGPNGSGKSGVLQAIAYGWANALVNGGKVGSALLDWAPADGAKGSSATGRHVTWYRPATLATSSASFQPVGGPKNIGLRPADLSINAAVSNLFVQFLVNQRVEMLLAKAAKRYDAVDVLEALHIAFLGKCYLCETEIEVGTFEVDHRKPRSEPRFSHLEHAWENLYPTCKLHGCNQRRGQYPAGELLDPGQGVELRVMQRIEGGVSPSARRAEGVGFVFHAVDATDTAAVNTAAELDRIHNAGHSKRPGAARALRVRILEHVVAILPRVYEYVHLAAHPSPNRADLEARARWVKERMSRRAPYAMLVRSYFGHLPPSAPSSTSPSATNHGRPRPSGVS